MTLTLTRRPSYTNLTRIPWRYAARVNMNSLHGKAFESCCLRDRHTDRQTDKTKIQVYTTPIRGWSINTSVFFVLLTFREIGPI